MQNTYIVCIRPKILDFLRELGPCGLLDPHDRSGDAVISGAKLNHEGESKPVIGATEER